MSTATCCTETANLDTQSGDQQDHCCFKPAVDIIEQGDELVIAANIPGSTGENISVEFEDGTLTLRATVGQRQVDDTRYLRHEYGVGDYCRRFRIGDTIDASRIKAEYADGVLALHLPKRESVKPRRIEVRCES